MIKCKKPGPKPLFIIDANTKQKILYQSPAKHESEFPSIFTEFCTDNGIEHIRTSKKRPTTTGKVEAFHGCYEMEAWRFKTHSAYIRHWNYSRPHGAIGYLYPVEVFYKDRKKSAINSG